VRFYLLDNGIYHLLLKTWHRSSESTLLIEPWAKRTQWHGKNSGAVAGWS